MAKPLILAFVIFGEKKKAISILPLTSDYTFEVVTALSGRKPTTTIQVLAATTQPNRHLAIPVDSLTVVYGENGEGKTSLLLEMCNAFAPGSHGRRIATIWRDKDEVIYVDGEASSLSVSLSGPNTASERRHLGDRIGTVFYTTSPFESTRRRGLTAQGTLDVTPSFSSNSFGAVSLCLAASALPKDIPFIKRARIQVELPQLDVKSEIQSLIATQDDEYSRKRFSYKASDFLNFSKFLEAVSEELTPRRRTLLAIELRRARLDGPKASELLFYHLFGRSRRRIRENVNLLLEDHLHVTGGKVPASRVLRSLRILQQAGSVNRSEGLLAHARTLRTLSPLMISSLQEAEDLGLLKWKFLELSSGQVALLVVFASLSNALDTLRRRGLKRAILVIDEGEMFMHPSWQRKYLHDLLFFVRRYRGWFEEIHLVLATHSLIVAGDAPPNRLFDVKSGEIRNGFAYGPREVLTDVYGVSDFSGEITEKIYERIVDFLRAPRIPSSLRDQLEIKDLIDSIASSDLRDYLMRQFQLRVLNPNA